MDTLSIKDIADFGASGFLAVAVYLLWIRLGKITDRLFSYLEDAQAERKAIAEAAGLDTQDLNRAKREAKAKRLHLP